MNNPSSPRLWLWRWLQTPSCEGETSEGFGFGEKCGFCRRFFTGPSSGLRSTPSIWNCHSLVDQAHLRQIFIQVGSVSMVFMCHFWRHDMKIGKLCEKMLHAWKPGWKFLPKIWPLFPQWGVLVPESYDARQAHHGNVPPCPFHLQKATKAQQKWGYHNHQKFRNCRLFHAQKNSLQLLVIRH